MKFSSCHRAHLLKNSSQTTVIGHCFLSHSFCFPDDMAAYEYNFRLRIASYIVRTRRVFSLEPIHFSLNDQKTETTVGKIAGHSWEQS